MFEAAALAFVLTTRLGVSFNLSAPGAFSFANPDALSSRDVSTLLLTVLSTVLTPTTSSFGLFVYFETIISCSANLWNTPFWNMTPSPTVIWNDLPVTLNCVLPPASAVNRSSLATVTLIVSSRLTLNEAAAVLVDDTTLAVG